MMVIGDGWNFKSGPQILVYVELKKLSVRNFDLYPLTNDSYVLLIGLEGGIFSPTTGTLKTYEELIRLL